MYNWQWGGLRRYIILYWRGKGVLVRRGYWNRKEHLVKLFNRNCISGKKSKSLACFVKALHLIHIFVYYYARKTRSVETWKFRRYPYASLDNFFFWNRPFFTQKIKIRKKMVNKSNEYEVWEKKMPMELLKWFWLLSFSQPFKKAYQRYAFILLEFIFFTDNNMFRALITKLRAPERDEFDRERQKMRRRRTRKHTLKSNFFGYIDEV